MSSSGICSTATNKVKSWVLSVKDQLEPYTDAIINTVLIAATVGVEQITTVAAYHCPCVELSQLGEECTNATIGSAACSDLLNIGYGLSLLIAPAIILYILGIGLSNRFWKSCTGFRYKMRDLSVLEGRDFRKNVLLVMLGALIYPVVWMAVALIDGRFLACALTSLPYEMKQKNCEEIAAANYEDLISEAFQNNATFSETIGWIYSAASVVFGFILYVIVRYNSPLTFYHGQYYRYYRAKEEQEFKQALKADAQRQAQESVNRFVESTREERSKPLWDEISTVFEFHRHKNNLDVYSNLHEWAKKERYRERGLVHNTSTAMKKKKNENNHNPNSKSIELANLLDEDAV